MIPTVRGTGRSSRSVTVEGANQLLAPGVLKAERGQRRARERRSATTLYHPCREDTTFSQPSPSFYVTTPIYYPNGEPHLGHVYTTLCADTVARYHRLRGDDVFLLTGTDEHGAKMVRTAEALGVTPAELADRNAAVFQAVWRELGVTHDDFIRTTQPRHRSAVQEVVRHLQAAGDVYLGSYEGWYDEGQ
jgi:leucyl-tRNA synthetase